MTLTVDGLTEVDSALDTLKVREDALRVRKNQAIEQLGQYIRLISYRSTLGMICTPIKLHCGGMSGTLPTKAQIVDVATVPGDQLKQLVIRRMPNNDTGFAIHEANQDTNEYSVVAIRQVLQDFIPSTAPIAQQEEMMLSFENVVLSRVKELAGQ